MNKLFDISELSSSSTTLMPVTESGEYPIPGVGLEQYYSNIGKWIDNGKFTFDITEEMNVQDFERHTRYKFTKIADCVYNTRINFPSSNRVVINSEDDICKVVSYVPCHGMKELWNLKKTEWVYVITWNGYILKIGMTSAGMSSRFGSYESGYKDTMRTGSTATTNFVINESNYLALSHGYNVEVYAHKLEPVYHTVHVGDRECKVRAEIAPAVETVLTEIYAENQGKNAPLCGQKKS
jgi:hypothetical protein